MTSVIAGWRDAPSDRGYEETHRVVVVGAGVTGLAAALTLQRAGVDVVVCDAAPVAGGVVRTTESAGCLLEAGPHSMHASPAVMAALHELDLAASIIPASAAVRRRYLLHDGRLVALPGSPVGLLLSPLLSTAGKARLLAEPLVRGTGSPNESVAHFARRRFGHEAADRLVSAFVAGVYAADASELSIAHAFPGLHDLERRHGSILVGAIRARRAQRRAGAAEGGSVSFEHGMGALPGAMARALGNALRLNSALLGVESDGRVGWRLRFRSSNGQTSILRADRVILALPAYALAKLAVPIGMRAGLTTVAATPHSAVSVWSLAFRRVDVAHPLDGFGFLVPEQERSVVLGALFASSMFPRRCPEGQVLLSAFVREVRDDRDDPGLDDVLRDLRDVLGTRGAPLMVAQHTHAQGIPLKGHGHASVLDAATVLEAEHPGIQLAGSWRSGVAAGECLVAGMRTSLDLLTEGVTR